jgi:hypothetical protein
MRRCVPPLASLLAALIVATAGGQTPDTGSIVGGIESRWAHRWW